MKKNLYSQKTIPNEYDHVEFLIKSYNYIDICVQLIFIIFHYTAITSYTRRYIKVHILYELFTSLVQY